ncbi:MAG: PH domain-containing protein [Acidimicrobiales bacterium]
MTSSELPPPPAPPPPEGGFAAGPPPTRAPVPLDAPLRTSPLTIALEAIGLGFFALSLWINQVTGGEPADVPGLVIGFAFTLQRTVGWWFRTYTVTDTSITLDEGILQKRHRVVPFTRIQQVEHRQQLTSRLFRLVSVHIETAGDARSTAISLRSLDVSTADALRDHLLAEQHRVRAGLPAAPRGEGAQWSEAFRAPTRTPLLRVSHRDLLVAGLTSNGAVAAATLAVVPSALIAAVNVDGPAAVPAFLAIETAFTMLAVLLGAVGSLLGGWGFDLTSSDDDLHVTQGLLDRRQHTMPRHRLQHVRVVDNPVRRRLGVVTVQLFSAATPGRRDEQQTAITIPFARREGLGDLLVQCMGSARWRPPDLEPRSPVARRRAILRRTALTTAMTITIVVVLLPAGAVLTPLALLGIPWGRLAHRRAGSALDGDVLVVASGALVHHLELVPAERVQSRRTTASPFQRRLGLASLRLDVAGARRAGAPGLGDLGADVAAAVQQAIPSRPRAPA